MKAALEDPEPILGIFTGTVAGYSEKIEVYVYIAGKTRLDPLEATLTDFEYNGPQTTMFTRSDDGDGEIKYAFFDFDFDDDEKDEDAIKKLLTQTYTVALTLII